MGTVVVRLDKSAGIVCVGVESVEVCTYLLYRLDVLRVSCSAKNMGSGSMMNIPG